MIEKSQMWLRESADDALWRVRCDGGELVARVGDSYREWASDDSVIPGPPETLICFLLVGHETLLAVPASFG